VATNPSGNQIAARSQLDSAWVTLTGSLSFLLNQPSPLMNAINFSASTSFGSLTGNSLASLNVGNGVIMCLDAEL
jgi:hypothetical protein